MLERPCLEVEAFDEVASSGPGALHGEAQQHGVAEQSGPHAARLLVAEARQPQVILALHIH